MAEVNEAVAENTNTEVGAASEVQTSSEAANTQDTTSSEGATLLGEAPKNEEGEAEAGKEADATEGIPDKYDLSEVMPEGTEVDEKELAGFSDLAKELKLNNEQAQKLAKYGLEYLGRGVAAYEAQRQAQSEGWATTAKQELGKDFESTMTVCARGVEAIERQVPGIRQALNETGAGNRVEIIKAFRILGEALQEDPGKALNNTAAVSNTSWYPNSKF